MQKTTGLTHLLKSTGYSLQGLKSAFKNEAAFRQECYVAVILIPVALYFGDSPLEKALLIGSVLLVLMVELLNSAIENVVDRISKEHHTLAGRAKDQGSAAVFMAMLIALAIWITLLFF